MADKFVLITGASSDIGGFFLEAVLSRSNLPLIFVGSLPIHYLPSLKDRHYHHISMDANSHDSVDRAASLLEDLNISHFIQFHGASMPSDTLLNQSFSSLQYHLNVNVLSTVILLSKTIPSMINSGFGRITLMNTASSSHGGGKTSFGYGISKHSVDYIVKHMAKYYTEYNILTNCISPGFVNTKFHAHYMKKTKQDLESREKFVPLGRPCSPKEVSELFYNLTFSNSYISGQNIKIDGADFV